MTYTLDTNYILSTRRHIINEGVIKSGNSISTGEVVGLEKYAPISSEDYTADSGNSGAGTISNVAIRPDVAVQVGAYVLEVVETWGSSGASFQLVDPNGKVNSKLFVVPDGQDANLSFVGYELSLDIDNDTGTPFARGDFFTINVASGSGKWVPAQKIASNGSSFHLAVATESIDASAEDKTTALLKHGAVLLQNLTYDTSYNDEEIVRYLDKNQINAVD